MAAITKVNPSVEQANVSSGWNEAKADRPIPIAPARRRADPRILEQHLRENLVRAGDLALHAVEDAVRRMKLLREKHPGYILTFAAFAGVACGVLLRTRKVKHP
jgi:hypothetical protein